MEQKKISRVLLAAGAMAALGALVVCFAYVPQIGMDCREAYPELTHLFWPGLCYVWAVAALYWAALWQYFRICVRIGDGRSFCRENGMGLQMISRLLFLGAAGCILAPVLLALFSGQTGPVWVICLLFALASAAVGILAWALGKLLMRAVELQEENDLTV